jgi:hypothetical protein
MPTTAYFYRLETFSFFRLFTVEGDIEYKGCGNTEHRDQKARVLLECCLAKIDLRKGAWEHVLYCDGSLKGLAVPRV